jgi:diaminopimelate decarboxylase
MAQPTPPEEVASTDLVAGLVESNIGVADGQLLVGGLRIADIVAQHGTPLYVYDQTVLQRRFQALRDALPPNFDICYSVKANPNQALLRFFVERNCGLEIASSGEMLQALTAGCPPERILFAGPGKTEVEIAAAVAQGIGEIHVESLTEARRIAAAGRACNCPVRIALRVNPAASVQGGGMRMGAKPAPFGIDEDQLEEVLAEIAQETALEVVGIHLYVGTQILDAQVLLEQYRAGVEIARRVAARLGKPLSTIDLGGGLGVPYFAHERPLDLAKMRQGLERLAQEVAGDPALAGVRFIIEPGRFLVAEAGIYIARVTDVKISRGKRFVITDGGMHHHLAASGNLGQTIKRNFPVALVNKLNRAAGERVDVVGPLCTPLDVLARNLALPPVEIGDLVGVFQSGAYARAASPLGFLSRESPPEVLIAEGVSRLIRRRGSDADYLADQPESRHSGR